MNAALQQDWNTYGADAFIFEVIDQLEAAQGVGGDHRPEDLAGELAELERLWLDKLQPYGEKGYNSPPKGDS